MLRHMCFSSCVFLIIGVCFQPIFIVIKFVSSIDLYMDGIIWRNDASWVSSEF
jgi:hypothetical protein